MDLACADLLQKIPKATADGFFRADREAWYTLSALSRELSVSATGIEPRLGSCRKQQGKNTDGRLRFFYALSDVKKACTDLLKDVPLAGSEGFFKADGDTWGTITSFARDMKLDHGAIRTRIDSCATRQGKDFGGRLGTFYALSDVKKACADLLKDVPQAGSDGFFNADGEMWGTIGSLSRKLSISEDAILARISSCCNREGKDKSNQIRTFYALSDVEKACADLLKDVPQAGSDGFFNADGEMWGGSRALEGKLGISRPTIMSRIKTCSCRGREGRGRTGVRGTFYALSDVKKACADLIAKKKNR